MAEKDDDLIEDSDKDDDESGPNDADLDGLDNDSDDDEDESEPEPKPKPKKRPARKRTKAVPTIEGVPRTKLEKPDICKEVWDKLVVKYVGIERVPYSLNADINVDEVISHSKFGEGFVIARLSPTKVEVLFEDCIRKLVHSR